MDLFDQPPIPGLDVRGGFISPEEDQELIGRINGVGLTPFQFQGFEGKRLTHSFGWRYDFNDRSFSQSEPIRLAPPAPRPSRRVRRTAPRGFRPCFADPL